MKDVEYSNILILRKGEQPPKFKGVFIAACCKRMKKPWKEHQAAKWVPGGDELGEERMEGEAEMTGN